MALVLCAASTVLIFFTVVPAFADPISNGTDFQASDTTGDPFNDPTLNPTSAQQADQVAPFSFGAESGTVESWVYSGSTNNPYDVNGGGGVTGAMTFVYQITISGTTGDIASIGANNFGFNLTDVGYFQQDTSQILPTSVSRDLSGDTESISTVTFSFDDAIIFGQSSALLVVNTDATTFTTTSVSLQDDSDGTASSYAIYTPMIPAPEPSSIVLMVLGLAGLLAVARGRRSGRFAARAGS